MSNELEQLQAENVALRAALEQTLLKTRERVVREIARAALSSPTPAAERIKALEESVLAAEALAQHNVYQCEHCTPAVGNTVGYCEEWWDLKRQADEARCNAVAKVKE